MSPFNIDSPYLKRVEFESMRGEKLSIVFSYDQASILMYNNIPLRKDSTPEKLKGAVTREDLKRMAIFTREQAIEFVQARMTHFDSDVTQLELNGYRKSALQSVTREEDARDLNAFFDCLNHKDYHGAKAWWEKFDTTICEVLDNRLIAWITTMAETS